jgi:hypothetical protein
LPVYHVIYGLRIATNLPLPGLTVEPVPDSIDVRIRMREESSLPSPFAVPPSEFFYASEGDEMDSAPALRVGMLDGGAYFGLFYKDGARFAVQREGREVWADWPEGYTIEDACTYLVGPVMGFVLRLHGVICLHASAVAVGGRAIALVGSPGAGKSTTAAAFADRGFAVLSDDVAALEDRVDHFLVHPGYPRVNLWADSVRALFGSEDVLEPITPTWDKRYLPLDRHGRRFASGPLALGAIYVLVERDAKLTAPVIEEFAVEEALIVLVANTYVNYLLNREMRKLEFDLLSRVVASVPIRRVRVPANPSYVFGLCEAIAAETGHLTLAGSAKATRGDHFRVQP